MVDVLENQKALYVLLTYMYPHTKGGKPENLICSDSVDRCRAVIIWADYQLTAHKIVRFALWNTSRVVLAIHGMLVGSHFQACERPHGCHEDSVNICRALLSGNGE